MHIKSSTCIKGLLHWNRLMSEPKTLLRRNMPNTYRGLFLFLVSTAQKPFISAHQIARLLQASLCLIDVDQVCRCLSLSSRQLFACHLHLRPNMPIMLLIPSPGFFLLRPIMLLIPSPVVVPPAFFLVLRGVAPVFFGVLPGNVGARP